MGADRGRNVALGILAFAACGALLYAARPVFVPLLLASFLGMLLLPPLNWLSRFVPRWLAIVLLLLVIGLVVAAGSALILLNVQAIAAKVPFYTERFEDLFHRLTDFLENIGIDVGQVASGGRGLSRALEFLATSLESAASAVGQMALVGFLLIFVLLEAPKAGPKLAAAFTSKGREEVIDTVRSITARAQRYVIVKTLISIAIGGLTGLVLHLTGVDFPFLWAFLTFLLNYIPNLGPIIAVVPPVLLAALQFDSPVRALVTLGSLIVVQVGLGNIVEPRLMGRQVNLSPLVVLLAVVFWGWMWGLIGVLLAVPLTVTLQIVCAHVEPLRKVAVLLGDRVDPRAPPTSV